MSCYIGSHVHRGSTSNAPQLWRPLNVASLASITSSDEHFYELFKSANTGLGENTWIQALEFNHPNPHLALGPIHETTLFQARIVSTVWTLNVVMAPSPPQNPSHRPGKSINPRVRWSRPHLDANKAHYFVMGLFGCSVRGYRCQDHARAGRRVVHLIYK